MADGVKRSTGTVKWFNGWKGFGFITPDDENSEDLFVHQTSIKFDGFRTLYDGQKVEFDVEVGDDGRTRATEVVPLSSSPGHGGGRGRGYGRGRGRGGRYGSGTGTGTGTGVECYNCGRFGHLARDCYGGGGARGGRGYYDGGGAYGRGRGYYDGGGAYGRGRGYYDGGGAYGRGRGYYDGGGAYGRGRGGGRRGERERGRGRGRGECYNCGEEGHFARDCPNNAQD